MEEVAAAKTQSAELGTQLFEAAVAACDYSIRSGVANLPGDQLLWFGDR